MLLGLAGLMLSVPRFIAYALQVPGDLALEDVWARRASSATFDTIISSRIQALDFFDKGRSYRDIALAKHHMALRTRGDESKAYIAGALEDAKRALARSPGDATAWLRVASASAQKNGVDEFSIRGLMTSVATGPYETELLIERLEWLFKGRSFLSSEWDAQIDDQIRVAWHREPQPMIRMIRRTGSLDIVRRALEKPPSMAQHLDGAIADPNVR